MEDLKLWLQTGSINVFGRVFAGKDTVSRRLAEQLDAVVVGSGEILRDGDIPQRVRDIMDSGELIPSDDFREIIIPYLSKPELKDKPLVLSSVGRWNGEQIAVIEAAKTSNHPIKVALFIDIPEEETRVRWEKAQQLADRGERADDAEQVIDTRIAEFNAKTIPVIDYYRQLGLLIEIDGMPSRDEVFQNILDKLTAFAKKDQS